MAKYKGQGPPSPKKKKKPAKGTPAYFMSDEYKKNVSAGRTAKSARKVERKSKVKKYVSGVKKRVREYHAERGQKRAEKALKGMGGAAGLSPKKSKKGRVKSAVISKLTKAGRSKSRRKKVLKKLRGMPGTVSYTKPKGSKYHMTPAKHKMLGSKKGTKIRKGAVGADVTEGGVYAKYEKKSKAAGSFRKAFKSGCAGGAKSFSWDGRSYSCKKK